MVVKKKELKGLPEDELKKKLGEMEKTLIELRGEGRLEATRSVRKTIARIKTYLSELSRRKQS